MQNSLFHRHTNLIRLPLAAFLATGSLFLLGACASTPKDPALEKAGNPRVSNIPWNRPQGWEGGGAGGMGAFADPRYR